MSDYCFSDSDQYTSDDTLTDNTDWYQSLSDLEEDEADKTNSTQSIPVVKLESQTPDNGEQTNIEGCSSNISMNTSIIPVPSDDGSLNKSTTKNLKRRLSKSFEEAHENNGYYTHGIKKKPRRKCRSCPIKGCTAVNLVKLSQHLLQTHNITDKAKRTRILDKARKVNLLNKSDE